MTLWNETMYEWENEKNDLEGKNVRLCFIIKKRWNLWGKFHTPVNGASLGSYFCVKILTSAFLPSVLALPATFETNKNF